MRFRLAFLTLAFAACQHAPATTPPVDNGVVAVVQVTPGATGAASTIVWTTTISGEFIVQVGGAFVVARNTVVAGASTTTTIPASALVTGQNHGAVVVVPSAGTPAVGAFTITLGRSAQLVFAPATYAFASRSTGTSTSTTFTLTNSGDDAATFAAPTTTNVGLAPPFAVSGGTCVGTTTLAPAASCTLAVSFAPTQSGASSAMLALSYGGASPAIIALSGTAVSPCDAIGTSSSYSAIGSGTRSDPYVLCTPAQLVGMSYATSAWNKSFRLGADIDLTGYGPTDTEPFHAIGTDGASSTPFTGTFDGAGHTVTHLAILSNSDNQGFFGHTFGTMTDIRNLNITGAQVASTGQCVGVLVGEVEGGSYYNCHVSGSVSGTDDVGGLIGILQDGSLLSTSSAAVNVQGLSTVNTVVGGSGMKHGGLIGFVSGDGGGIYNSYASGAVVGATSVGGFVGEVDSAIMSSSYSSGKVTSSGGVRVGGFFGYDLAATPIDCFTTSTVVGSDPDGGGGSGEDYVGAFGGQTDQAIEINTFFYSLASNCTNTGGVCNSYCQCPTGGATNACMNPAGDPTCNYSTSAPDASLADFNDPAGAPLVSWGSDFTEFWTVNPTAGGLPLQQPVTFFDEVAWGGCAAHLDDAPFAGGNGSPEAPFLICTADQLVALSSNTSLWRRGYVFKLMDDIDLSQSTTPFTPIGNTQNNGALWFLGFFDGNGKTISHLVLDDTNATDQYYAGLFGSMDGVIRRLGVVNASVITHGPQHTGIMVGNLIGSVLDSYTTGVVTNTNNGSFGFNDPSVAGFGHHLSFIFHSYSAATLTAVSSPDTQYGGATGAGLEVDQNNISVSGCFAQSTVTVSTHGGPLTGCQGTSTSTSSYYDSTRSCTNCTDPSTPTTCAATTTACTCSSQGSPTTQGFKQISDPPLSENDNYGWDFTNVWQSDGESLPTLR